MHGPDFLKLLRGVIGINGGSKFKALCPAHDENTASLSVTFTADRILATCFGCGAKIEQICEALGLQVADLYYDHQDGPPAKLTLESFSQAKRLPVSFLTENDVSEGEGTLTFHYLLMDGRRASRHHIRNFLKGKGDRKFIWGGTKTGRIVPYGLWHLSRWRKAKLEDLYLVEGESDALTLWLHGRAALGLPGAQTTDSLQAPHIAGFPRVWIVQEPGVGGEQFASRMRGRLAVLRCRAAVRVMRCGKFKDTNDLHCDGPEYFEARWMECQGAAEAADLEVAGFILRRLSEVEEEVIEWLWPNRLPLGKLSLFAGDGNLGKSLVSVDIAARLSRGLIWPDGRPAHAPGDTLILSSEDNAADTIKPRMRAAGADLNRIIVPEGLRMQNPDGLLEERGFNLRTDIGELAEALEASPNVKLVIIDPVSSYMGGTDGGRNSDVRGVLAPLGKLAEKYRCAILMVTHLRKGEGSPLHRIIDSVAFQAICRMVHMFVANPDREGEVIFSPVKFNIAKRDSSLTYIAEGVNMQVAGQMVEVPHVVWGAEESINLTTVMAVNSATAHGKSPKETRKAAELIAELLKDGPEWAKFIYDKAEENDISKSILLQAKNNMGVRVYKDKDNGSWMWSLEEEEAPWEGTQND